MKVNFYKTVKSIPVFSKKRVTRIVKKEVKNSGINEINIIIVGEKRIKRINYEFLKRNKITDVISFNLGSVAEIYICGKLIKDEKHLIRLIFHGFAHIMGYDHVTQRDEKVMRKYEDKLIRSYLGKK